MPDATATPIAPPAERRPHAPYNRGNPLVAMTSKVAANEREALEELAAAEGKSVSAVVREAIQRHVSRSARREASRTR
jgi:hypothetical protein